MKWSDLINVSVLLSLSGSLFAKNIPDYSPSGKLTQTFPRHAGQVPVAYNFRRSFARIEHADLEKGPSFLSVSG